ncbi:MAG: hypothetical protein SGJ13_17720 [Actinomycetota bacterium]|nr:hypothetical protein [Actinomycetota bacterium]
MKLRPALEQFGGSAETARAAAGMTRPCSLRAVVNTTDVIERKELIVSGGLAALGGHVSATVHHDGTVQFGGHAHDSGLDSYSFRILAILRPETGPTLAARWSGHVGGDLSTDERDEYWNEPPITHPIVAARFEEFRTSRLELIVDYESDIGSAFEEIAGVVTRVVAGTLLVTAGMATSVFLGLELGSLMTTGSLEPGARIAGNILWLVGPSGTIYAIVAEGIASNEESRELHEDEYNWANERVFARTLPPREDIRLTDTIGAESRAFAFPRWDKKITLNMGPAAFLDPRKYQEGSWNTRMKRKIVYGEVFVHELVHAWQIDHTPFDLALLADALSSKLCELTGGDPYDYGDPGRAFSSYNLEQQAQLVSDWFGSWTTALDSAPALADPRFRYVERNIRQSQT